MFSDCTFLDISTTEPTGFSFEGTTFHYGEHDYDLTLRSQSITSILSAVLVGNKIVIEGHCGPKNSVYCIFDTVSESFETDLWGHHLIWHSDDITTAVYAFWSDIYTYDGSMIKTYDLAENEGIYDLEYVENNTKLKVTIVRDNDIQQIDTLDLTDRDDLNGKEIKINNQTWQINNDNSEIYSYKNAEKKVIHQIKDDTFMHYS